jgi:very-short-patch-repair endonuclease
MQPVEKARILRQQQTCAEQQLWQQLRNRRLHGYKFRRQYPVGQYVVDFVCLSGNLIVELDGEHHAEPECRAYDHERTQFLQAQGFRVRRFWNHEISGNIEGVLGVIVKILTP